MIGESVGYSRQQRHLGRRPLRKCKKNRVEGNNIVFIDVESDSFENVIIIDSPNSLPTKNGDGLWKGIILLDDDEDMDDDFVGAGVKSGKNFKNGVSTNIKSNTSSGNFEETPAMSEQAEDEAAGSFIHKKKGDGVLMMGDREKLKQTDEYKKALEEELASRQRALQVQAEEAQKLLRVRKRMKAEAARVLELERRKKELERRQKELERRQKELERRQKERIEEMRETQKKDEKNSNLKDIIRAEVRKNLKTLELTCRDMASLLLGLGIPVGDGLQRPPLSSEVQSAYKRALLAFHPDRSSRSDVRQQVEAEEKFKLISRMKEKFLPS